MYDNLNRKTLRDSKLKNKNEHKIVWSSACDRNFLTQHVLGGFPSDSIAGRTGFATDRSQLLNPVRPGRTQDAYSDVDFGSTEDRRDHSHLPHLTINHSARGYYTT